MKLLKQFFHNHFVQFVIAGFFALTTLLLIFNPGFTIIKKLDNYTFQFMLFCLMSGMFFLLFDQRKLILTSFACCGALCLYLKSASNNSIRLAEVTAEPKVSIAYVNLADINIDYNQAIRRLSRMDSDVISFQELTPDWNKALSENLAEEYPFKASLVRLDPFGHGIYSRYPFSLVDTFYFEEIPNLRVSIQTETNTPIHIVSSHPVPAISGSDYDVIREHFHTVAHYIDTLAGGILTVGDYHLTSWADEIQEFKFIADLSDSRRDINPGSIQGSISLFKVPKDHIFYNEQIECTNFNVITDQNSSHMGIIGHYQLNNKIPIREAALQ